MSQQQGQQALSPLVILAIDGSAQAESAFKWYLSNIHKEDNRLLLLHCVEPLHVIGEVPNADLYTRMLQESKSKAKELEEHFAQMLRENNVPGKIMAVFGSKPGEALVDMGIKEKAAMIVMGTRGLGTMRRTIMGSVSDYVVHHAKCPVVICRH